jgi:hypothetical protein
MREELAKLVANVIDGVDPDTPADIDGSECMLVAANLVTLARTAVEFARDVVDSRPSPRFCQSSVGRGFLVMCRNPQVTDP